MGQDVLMPDYPAGDWMLVELADGKGRRWLCGNHSVQSMVIPRNPEALKNC